MIKTKTILLKGMESQKAVFKLALSTMRFF
jgi:hypothetical protein